MFARQLRHASYLDSAEQILRKHISAPEFEEAADPLGSDAVLTPSAIQRLQRTHGNQFVRRLAEQRQVINGFIQRACDCQQNERADEELDEANIHAVQRDLPFEPASYGEAPQGDQAKKDPEGFCTPYESELEILAAKTKILSQVIPFLATAYNLETAILYTEFVTTPSSTTHLFSDPNSAFVQSYVNSPITTSEVVKIVNEIKDAIPGRVKLDDLPPGEEVRINIMDFIGEDGLRRQTNYDLITEAPGVTAGGISSSDFGDDFRQIDGEVVFVRVVDAGGKTTDVMMTTELSFTVADAIDFCPGDSGLPEEHKATLPLSRLEASGRAFDRPFVVEFRRTSGPTRIDPARFQSSGSGTGGGGGTTTGGATGAWSPNEDDTGVAVNDWFESVEELFA